MANALRGGMNRLPTGLLGGLLAAGGIAYGVNESVYSGGSQARSQAWAQARRTRGGGGARERESERERVLEEQLLDPFGLLLLLFLFSSPLLFSSTPWPLGDARAAD